MSKQPVFENDGLPCAICGGPNDMGEICAVCADQYAEQIKLDAVSSEKAYQKTMESMYGDWTDQD